MRLVVFDDALRRNDRGWTVDNFTAALRPRLAAMGVRVVRGRDAEGNSDGGGFRVHGLSKSRSEKLQRIVESVLSLHPPQGGPSRE
jgi:hypothetical protein